MVNNGSERFKNMTTINKGEKAKPNQRPMIPKPFLHSSLTSLKRKQSNAKNIQVFNI